MQATLSSSARAVAIGLIVALLAVMLWSGNEDTAAATSPVPAAARGQFEEFHGDGYPGLWFAKYDGIDGESVDENHRDWIDILEYSWGLEAADLPSEARRRGGTEIAPFTMRFDYEKAAPKLLDRCAKNAVIPRLEVELTRIGETRPTYLRYEMTNVTCTAYQVGGIADGTLPGVVVTNDFEEIKVTYTEYDISGAPQGNIETTIKVGG